MRPHDAICSPQGERRRCVGERFRFAKATRSRSKHANQAQRIELLSVSSVGWWSQGESNP